MSHFFQFNYNHRLVTISLWEVSSLEQYSVAPGSKDPVATPTVIMNNGKEYPISLGDSEALLTRLNDLVA